MKKETFKLLESYMLSCMDNNAHDKEHIYRVLYTALDIAQSEENVNGDILIAACLLHDIGRKEQFENPKLCHAEVGAKKAYNFLIENGFENEFAAAVSDCISAHRFRGNNPPKTIEAKILFDSDKIDVAGTMGIARTLYYNSYLGEPLYNLDENKNVLKGEDDNGVSFFQEYKFKLEKVYSKLQTKRGKEIAESRRKSAEDFYNSMLSEVCETYEAKNHLKSYLV
ncbi:MAG: HD domain-containing protein [Ruminococcaceae bacterium]|nr:HD domain-containing protein [Oscillospiraceae bacterium]